MWFETEYIGKSAVDSHYCRCEACHRLTMLNSYTTTRFVIFFHIPLLPLGRFRIIDECLECGHRSITSIRKYGRIRDRELKLMMDGFATEADNPYNCAHALQTLMVYHMESWFHDVRKSYGLRFENNAEIQRLIAQGLIRFGHYQKAIGYCRKALVLGADRQGEELLDCCQKLCEAAEGIPDLEALKIRAEPVWKAYVPLMTLGTAAAVIISAAAISSLRTYKAWIVNGSLDAYSFTLDDRQFNLEPGDARKLTLHLGSHILTAEGMPPQEFEYSIPLIKQWLGKNMVVINPDGMALLAVNSNSRNERDAKTSYSTSGRIRVIPGISDPAHGLKRLSPDAQVTPSIGLYRPETHLAMVNLMARLGLQKACVEYARQALLRNPDSQEATDLLPIALANADDADALAFLRNGLDVYPALLPWHLYYQDYMLVHHPEHNLEREYTSYCRDHADEAAGYYLLGRVVADPRAAYKLFEHSDRNNGMGGQGLHAIAHDLYIRGRFAEALSYSRKALERNPQETAFRALNENILLALRDYDALLQEHLDIVGDTPSCRQVEKTIVYLTCAGYHQEAAAEIRKHGERCPDDLTLLNAVRFYAVGNVDDYLNCMSETDAPHADMERLLHENRIVQAEQWLSADLDHPYWEHLVLYCAAMRHSQQEIAESNLSKAIMEVGNRTHDYLTLRHIFSGEDEPTAESIIGMDIPAPEKALLCAALSFRFPDNETFIELFERYNFTPAYPQLLLKKLIGNPVPQALTSQ